MSVGRRRELIEPEHLRLSITRQCKLVSISRSSYYGPAKGEPTANLNQAYSNRKSVRKTGTSSQPRVRHNVIVRQVARNRHGW